MKGIYLMDRGHNEHLTCEIKNTENKKEFLVIAKFKSGRKIEEKYTETELKQLIKDKKLKSI